MKYKLLLIVTFSVFLFFAMTISSYSKTITKAWYPDEYAEEYIVEISTDTFFANVIETLKIKNTSFEIDLENGIYYIRVAGIKGVFHGEWSEYIELIVKDDIDPLAVIVKASCDTLKNNLIGDTKKEVDFRIKLRSTKKDVLGNPINLEEELSKIDSEREKSIIAATAIIPPGWDIMLYKDQYDFKVFSMGLKLGTPIQKWFIQEIDTMNSRLKVYYYVMKDKEDANKFYDWFLKNNPRDSSIYFNQEIVYEVFSPNAENKHTLLKILKLPIFQRIKMNSVDMPTSYMLQSEGEIKDIAEFEKIGEKAKYKVYEYYYQKYYSEAYKLNLNIRYYIFKNDEEAANALANLQQLSDEIRYKRFENVVIEFNTIN